MTVPIPWLIDKEVALDVVQVRVEELPDVIVLGLVVNEEIVGAGGGGVVEPKQPIRAELLTTISSWSSYAFWPLAGLSALEGISKKLYPVVVL